MVYKFSIKKNLPNIERLMDNLISEPYVLIKDNKQARNLGRYARPLRKKKILLISGDIKLKESVAVLKINNYTKKGSVKKKVDRNKINYLFEDTLLRKL